MNIFRRIISRLTAWCVVTLLVLSAWLFALRPMYAYVKNSALELEQKLAQRDQLRTNVLELEQDIEKLSGTEVTGIEWHADQIGELNAQIQARVSEIASSNSLKLRSLTPTGNRDLPSTSATVMRVEGEATLDALADFLLELENHTPVLMVDRAVLRRLNRAGPNPEQPLVFVQLQLLAPFNIEGTLDEPG